MKLFTKYLVLISFFYGSMVVAQQPAFKSIMQEQANFYSQYKNYTDVQFDSLNNTTNNKLASSKQATCNLTKKVLGWHPYWGGTTYTNYQWSLLSDLVYFDYDVSG